MEVDCRFNQVLEEIEAAAAEEGSSAKELVAWAKINARTLQRRNAETLFQQWEVKLRNAHDIKLLDISKLINQMGDFDSYLKDSRLVLEKVHHFGSSSTVFEERFQLGYPMLGMGRVLTDMKNKVDKSDLTWPMQHQDAPSFRSTEQPNPK